MRLELGGWRAFVEQPGYRFRDVKWRVFVFRDVSDTEMEFLHADGTITRHKHEELLPDDAGPTFELDQSAAQSLMTEFWKQGLRPDVAEAKETPSLLREVLATQALHLEDMRMLVFKEKA